MWGYRGQREHKNWSINEGLREWRALFRQPDVGRGRALWCRLRSAAIAEVARGLFPRRRCVQSLGIYTLRALMTSGAGVQRPTASFSYLPQDPHLGLAGTSAPQIATFAVTEAAGELGASRRCVHLLRTCTYRGLMASAAGGDTYKCFYAKLKILCCVCRTVLGPRTSTHTHNERANATHSMTVSVQRIARARCRSSLSACDSAIRIISCEPRS